MRTNIIVNFTFEGIHQWSGAPDKDEKEPVVKDVEFLRNPHRHIFHVTAKKQVSHLDRDIEIIMLKRKMERFFGAAKVPAKLGQTSCEQLCKIYIDAFKLDYCMVLEDGENGAEIFADDLEPTKNDTTKGASFDEDLFGN